jgi:hypothetical protein
MVANLNAGIIAGYVTAFLEVLLGVKTVRRYVIEYETELTAPIAGYFNGAGGLRSVRATFQRAIREYARPTYIEGITDGNGSADDFDEEDAATVEAWIAEQLLHVDGLVDAVREAQQATDRTAAQQMIFDRVKLWVNALADLGGRGKLRAQEGALAYWVLGDTEEHCDDCLRYSRFKPRRLKRWLDDEALPRARNLACNGYNCDCTLRNPKTNRILYPVA